MWYRLYLDEQIVPNQTRDLDERAGGTVWPEIFLAGDVDFLAVGDVLEKHGHLAHVGERRAGGRETTLQIFVNLAGLGRRVVAAHRAPLPVRRDTARDEHEPPGAHDVGEVADGLGHSGNADLFTPAGSMHGPPLTGLRPGTRDNWSRRRDLNPRPADYEEPVIHKFRALRAGAPANRGRTRQEMQPIRNRAATTHEARRFLATWSSLGRVVRSLLLHDDPALGVHEHAVATSLLAGRHAIIVSLFGGGDHPPAPLTLKPEHPGQIPQDGRAGRPQ